MKLLRILVKGVEWSETSMLKSPQTKTFLLEIIIDSVLCIKSDTDCAGALGGR